MQYVCDSCGEPTDNAMTIAGIERVFHTCDACETRIRREIEWGNRGDQFRENTVICPYCGFSYEDYDAYGFDEGKTDEVVCPECGKKFDLEVEDIRYFSTRRSLCEMPEGFDPDTEDDDE